MRYYADPKAYGPKRKEEWFLKISPKGILPVIIIDGKIVKESDWKVEPNVILSVLELNFGELNN